MAQAFGGQVIKSPKGWGVGEHRYAGRAAALDGFAAPIRGLAPGPGGRAPPGADSLRRQRLHALRRWPGATSRRSRCSCTPSSSPAYAIALIESRRGDRYSDEQADAAIATLQAAQ
jgi:hypothetical protein